MERESERRGKMWRGKVWRGKGGRKEIRREELADIIFQNRFPLT
jgi:hypothetical protein